MPLLGSISVIEPHLNKLMSYLIHSLQDTEVTLPPLK